MVRLEEEEKLTIVEVAGKVKKAFDVEHVTKSFFNSFKNEHETFLGFIEGIIALADRKWYASLMLNRLMFIYFIQKKKFLEGDADYLRNRLQMVRQSQGKDKFHSFYRYFLLRLFHEGLAQRKDDRTEELRALLGNVPYLNGGLFDTHQLEKDNPEIHIPDKAFERLFNFFDEWDWHLDTRTVRKGNEINPDVLGYIFEKYINDQAQMGAYYTREDITEYISKSTIVPFLFDAAEKKCAIAFRPEGAVWRLLRDDPDRYIYDAVKKSVDLSLPEDIAAGVTDVSKRGGWNRSADEAFALPTETWREHVARRTRCLEIRAKLAGGEIHNINDLITYNLDLRQFAQDVIETCEGPDLLRAFYKSIEEISVLDPTCGSGAFLFAALNVLEPLYEACLERMEAFVEELDKSREKHHPEKFSDFRKVLEQANDRTKHPSRRYFILKSIVLKNLYGVDIMAEAVEICKLRLFLKLVAQVERVEDVEPLPDIDFNIRAGNTLVGFTSLEAVRQAMTVMGNGQHRLPSPEDQAALKGIDESAELADRAFRRFREQQTDYGMAANQYSATKADLQKRLVALRTELDRHLATEYGVEWKNANALDRWQVSHQPFHWFVEFYGIMANSGFDIIIGNPPYVEYSKIRGTYSLHSYVTAECGNLYAFMIERAMTLLKTYGSFGFIVPISTVCTQRMTALQTIVRNSSDHVWLSNFAERPSKLFVGAEVLLTIWISRIHRAQQCNVFTTGLTKWASEERASLFARIAYQPVEVEIKPYVIPKLSSSMENNILNKIIASRSKLGAEFRAKSSHPVYYRIGGGRYWKIFTNFQPRFVLNCQNGVSSRENYLYLESNRKRDISISILGSSIFYWYFILTTNCRDLNPSDLREFPISLNSLAQKNADLLEQLCEALMGEYRQTSRMKNKTSSLTGEVTYQEFYPRLSKPLLDEIDRVLAKHYGFAVEELDFIINYDIKYRMGTDSDAEDE